MNKYNKLYNKLKNNEKINLLFVSPDYGDLYPFSKVETSYFSKDKFNCDLKLITNKDIPNILNLFLLSDEYDCVVNLCDGYIGNTDNIPGLNFLDELEKNNIPYTGANKRVFSLSKFDIQVSEYTPKSIHIKNYLENNLCIECFKFPLFVKPNNLGCSEHIDCDSLVKTREELDIQLQKILKFTDDIIIQEYINGYEYTALVFRDKYDEIICLSPIKLGFEKLSIDYLTNYTKINESDNITYEYDIDENIASEIKKRCVAVYKNLNLNSYVRMDIRNITIVDVNSYPEIFGPVDEEDMNDVIIRKFYDFDEFMYDMLYDSFREV
jgi:D-alanine-D-alanine ligase-like ATP-grasp enzyme